MNSFRIPLKLPDSLNFLWRFLYWHNRGTFCRAIWSRDILVPQFSFDQTDQEVGLYSNPTTCNNKNIVEKIIFDFLQRVGDFQLPLYSNSAREILYSGDLNSEHRNSGNIWKMNFYLFAIQMPANSSFNATTQFLIRSPTDQLPPSCILL